MQRGRKPKPVALHKLEGTYSATRHSPRQAEPEAPGELADAKPPEWMTASQRTLWRELIADAPKGILRRADRRLFIAYVVGCDHFETAARTQNRLDETGAPLLMRTASGSSLSSYLKIMIRYSPLLLQNRRRIGLLADRAGAARAAARAARAGGGRSLGRLEDVSGDPGGPVRGSAGAAKPQEDG